VKYNHVFYKEKEGATGIDIQKGENFDSPQNLLVETRLYLVTEQQKHTYVSKKKSRVGMLFLPTPAYFGYNLELENQQ
jgi:hypothetical protein